MRYSEFTICNMAASHLVFSWPHCHAILLLSAKFNWSRTKIGCCAMAKTIFKMQAIRHLEFRKFSYLVIWLSSIPNVQLCTQFRRNRMIFRWNMAISQASRWRMSAILNFRGVIMGCLKSLCKTSIETIALNCVVFEKIAFFVCISATDRRTDNLDALRHSCSRYRPLAVPW